MKIVKIIPFITTIILMCLIFSFSAQNAATSANVSRGITQKIVRIIYKNATGEEQEKKVKEIHTYVRKTAHFVLFAALGVSSAAMFFVIGKKPVWAIAWGFCILCAIGDETHQLFVGGRAPMIKDVAIDSVGALFGVFFTSAVKKLWGRGHRYG